MTSNIAGIHEDWTFGMLDQKRIDRQWHGPIRIAQQAHNLEWKNWMAWLELRVLDLNAAGGDRLNVHACTIVLAYCG